MVMKRVTCFNCGGEGGFITCFLCKRDMPVYCYVGGCQYYEECPECEGGVIEIDLVEWLIERFEEQEEDFKHLIHTSDNFEDFITKLYDYLKENLDSSLELSREELEEIGDRILTSYML